jgi:hypothetical protein
MSTDFSLISKGRFRKNTCASSSTKRTVVLELDLSALPASTFDQGFSMRVAMLDSRWGGRRASSLKPESDGKYYGEPIF